MRERELGEFEFDILEHLLENGEQRFTEIAEALFPKHKKNFNYNEVYLKVVLVRKLGLLIEDGYIRKKTLGHKNVRYYVPDDKLEKVKKLLKKEEFMQGISRRVDKLTLQEIEELHRVLQEKDKEVEGMKRIIEELEKSNKIYYKILMEDILKLKEKKSFYSVYEPRADFNGLIFLDLSKFNEEQKKKLLKFAEKLENEE